MDGASQSVALHAYESGLAGNGASERKNCSRVLNAKPIPDRAARVRNDDQNRRRVQVSD